MGPLIVLIIITALLVSYLGWWGWLITGIPTAAYIIWWIIDEYKHASISKSIRESKSVNLISFPHSEIQQAFTEAIQKPVDLSVKSKKSNTPPPPNCPDDWWDRRERVLHRDGNKCILCGDSLDMNGHAHHIVKKSEGGSHEYSNLVSLCRSCHSVMDGHERMSHPGFILNEKTKCAHVYSCRYVHGHKKAVPSIPDGYKHCKACRPTHTAEEVAKASFKKKRRNRGPLIKEYLEKTLGDFETEQSTRDIIKENIKELT